MIENADHCKLDSKARNSIGKTGFQLAEGFRKFKNVDLIKRKLPPGTF